MYIHHGGGVGGTGICRHWQWSQLPHRPPWPQWPHYSYWPHWQPADGNELISNYALKVNKPCIRICNSQNGARNAHMRDHWGRQWQPLATSRQHWPPLAAGHWPLAIRMCEHHVAIIIMRLCSAIMCDILSSLILVRNHNNQVIATTTTTTTSTF